MQIDNMLLLRMNRQYLFTPAADELAVLRGLCGLQAQFYGNCLHALRLRCGKAPDEDILRTSTVKTWALRGTLHLIAQSDLPLFLYNGRSHFLRPCDTMENDDHLSAARKRELAAIILDAAQKGCGGREELRLLCREHGMTADEEQSAFDPWGGLLRALCESGVLSRTAQQKKQGLSRLYPLCAGIFAGLCGVLVHCGFENIFEEPYMMAYFWSLAGLLMWAGFLRQTPGEVQA